MPKTNYAFLYAEGNNIVLFPNYGTYLFRSVTEDIYFSLSILGTVKAGRVTVCSYEEE
jgi:hypothetical protein